MVFLGFNGAYTACIKTAQFPRESRTIYLVINRGRCGILLAIVCKLNHGDMLRNYLTIAYRHLTRHKLFSLINIFCLALGLTFSFLIGIYVLDEKSVNAGLRDIRQQYVIRSKWKQENMGSDITTLGPLAKTIRDEYPRLVAGYYRFDPVQNIVSAGDKHVRANISAGDTNLISLYGFPLLHGNPYRAFRDNQSAIVTEGFAEKMFGTTDVLNKIVTLQTPADGRQHDFAISAVLKAVPCNTVSGFTGVPYDLYLPMEANQYFQNGDKGDNWSNVFIVSMIKLQDGVKPQDLRGPFTHLLEKYQPSFVKGNLTIALVPLRDYYVQAGNGAIAKILSTLSLVAVVILMLAIINYVNIQIGASAYRLKEIGLRKVFGGARTQLIAQHMTESMVLTLASALLSLFLYELLRPSFGELLHTKYVPFWHFATPQVFFIWIIVILVGIVAGIYPAFVLSASKAALAVKGKIGSVRQGSNLRKVLLIVQFTLAISVIISTVHISRQVKYIFHKDIGFNKEQVMVVSSLPRQWDSAGVIRMEGVKGRLLRIPGVKGATLSYDLPDGSGAGNTTVYAPGSGKPFISMQFMGVDGDFASVYGIHLKEGVFLHPPDGPPVPGQVVLNETAAKQLGLSQATGRTFHLGAPDGAVLTIAGVVKDFQYESIQKRIQPLLLFDLNEPFTRSFRYFSLRMNPSNIDHSITAVQDACKNIFPASGFEYAFMDQTFQQLYQSELQMKKAAGIATMLNLVIVLLGLFGVLAFTLAQRTKEIAVRKLLGAKIRAIIWIFLREYAWLILIANMIAWPLAYAFVHRWLENYAYRIDQSLVPYAFVSLFVFALSFLFIALQSFSVASANPVKNLRVE
jgi:putative ABC transport system permease protein